MKRKYIYLFLTSILLSSCDSVRNYEIQFGYGDGNKENDRIGVDFKLSSIITPGYELKGTFYSEKEAPIQENTLFSIVDSNPAMSSSYKENILFQFRKKDLTKNDDGSHSMNFSVRFTNLEYYFEAVDDKTFFFFIHGEEFQIGNIYTYSALDYGYRFDGKKVTLKNR